MQRINKMTTEKKDDYRSNKKTHQHPSLHFNNDQYSVTELEAFAAISDHEHFPNEPPSLRSPSSRSVYRWPSYYFWPRPNETENPPSNIFLGGGAFGTSPITRIPYCLTNAHSRRAPLQPGWLAGVLSPPMKLKQIDLPNCCLWNRARSGVWGNHIHPVKFLSSEPIGSVCLYWFSVGMCFYLLPLMKSGLPCFWKGATNLHASQMRHLAGGEGFRHGLQTPSAEANKPALNICFTADLPLSNKYC